MNEEYPVQETGGSHRESTFTQVAPVEAGQTDVEENGIFKANCRVTTMLVLKSKFIRVFSYDFSHFFLRFYVVFF